MGFLTAKKLIGKVGKGAVTKQVGVYENIARWIARAIQLVFALVAVSLYARRVDVDRRAGNAQSVRWLYAVFVGGASCITCLLYSIPFIPAARAFPWDLTLFVLWIACFGTFAVTFLKIETEEYEGTSVRAMKVALWFDVINAVLWLATGGYGAFRTFVGRRAKGLENRFDKEMGDFQDRAVNKAMDKAMGRFQSRDDPSPPQSY